MATNPELEYAVVGVVFKHLAGSRYSIPFEQAQLLAREIVDRLVVDDYVELGHLPTASELVQIKQSGSGFYGDTYRVTQFGSDKIIKSLRLKEVDS